MKAKKGLMKLLIAVAVLVAGYLGYDLVVEEKVETPTEQTIEGE